jgi:hypothetical protein
LFVAAQNIVKRQIKLSIWMPDQVRHDGCGVFCKIVKFNFFTTNNTHLADKLNRGISYEIEKRK